MVTQPIAFEHFEEALRSKGECLVARRGHETLRAVHPQCLGGQIVLGLAIYQLLWDDLLRNWENERVQFKGRELICKLTLISHTYPN
ncbi:hypothetical protein TVAGG3_0319790, partial [Trichomonas vaginalis G3]|uniref:hypothetical protein n=1 Tax=Trichomonas vaginalis (strain ATCC PRA-98 / G3) TaxID=412133 RepID=UPI0021E56BEB